MSGTVAASGRATERETRPGGRGRRGGPVPPGTRWCAERPGSGTAEGPSGGALWSAAVGSVRLIGQRVGEHPPCIGIMHTRSRSPSRSPKTCERRHPVPSAHGGAQPEAAMARVVRLLRRQRLRRRPRHRVQRDPRGGRADRRHARSSSTASPGPTRKRSSTGSSPATRPSSQVGQVFYTPVVRRARQGHRRRHRPPARRRPSYRWTAADPQLRWLRLNARGLDVDDRGGHRVARRARPPGPAVTGACWRPPPASRSATCATSVAAPPDRPASPSTSRAPATPATSATSCGSPAERAAEAWDALMTGGRAYGIRPAGMLALDVIAARGRPHPARGRLHLGASRAQPGAELLARSSSALGRLVALDKADFVGPARALARAGAGRAGAPARRRRSSTGTASSGSSRPRACRPPSRPPSIARRCRSSRRGGGARSARSTSHGWSPILKQAIALASVPPAYEAPRHAAGDRVDGRGPPRPRRRDRRADCPSSTCRGSAA